MKKIFLSYRRADSAHVTDRIYACLRQEFGEHAIFKDVDDVPIGEDFREHIADAVGRCDILLAVIGHNWLDIQDEKGNRRLEDKDDFVRVEIESALTRVQRIPVVPLLVHGVDMPDADKIPVSIRKLAFRNAMSVGSDPDFHKDMNRLIRRINKHFADTMNADSGQQTDANPEQESFRNLSFEKYAFTTLLLAIALLLAGIYLYSDKTMPIDSEKLRDKLAIEAQQLRLASLDAKLKKQETDRLVEEKLIRETAARLKAQAEQKKRAESAAEHQPLAVLAAKTIQPLDSFQESLSAGGKGPEMVVVPAGSFLMGAATNEAGSDDNEYPQHRVNIPAFAIGKYEVTFSDYDQFAQATGRDQPGDSGWGRGQRPVINVSWTDAQAYTEWLSAQTGNRYRLPSEAEWEYAARAGTTTDWFWGDDEALANQFAWFRDNSDEKTQPVGKKKPNTFGLYDMAGNVWEWVEDTSHDSYTFAPQDGSPWISGNAWEPRVLRGGTWYYSPAPLRSASRYGFNPDIADNMIGFRVVCRPPSATES